MAFIIKERARTFTAQGKVKSGWYPNSVGGMAANEPAVLLQVGEHKVFLSEEEWLDVSSEIDKLRKLYRTGG